MSTNVVNQVAYLRTSREFPEDLHQLTVEVNRAYVDTAQAVNSRIIGLFPTNRPAITGESWFINQNRSQQTLREVFTFTNTASINHGINVVDPNQFTHGYGSYTNGANSFGILFGTSVAVAGILSFYVTLTQIVFVVGAGSPTLTSGKIVLEWLSQP